MHISIAGKLGSGKSTICNKLKEKYGYAVYSTGEIHREIANQQKVSTLEMNKIMSQNTGYDFNIDDAVTKISIAKGDEVIVFDSRMAWKFAQNSFKIFVVVDPLVAATRVMQSPRGKEEVYTDVEDARIKLIERSQVENERFKQLYEVDNFDYGNYNLVIDSTHASPALLTDIIHDTYKAVYKNHCKNPGSHEILLAPASLFPLKPMGDIDLKKVAAYRGDKAYQSRPVSIAVHDGYHYIMEGHHRMLAAVLNKEDFVPVKRILADPALVSKAKAVGAATLKDYETAGQFTYASRPAIYTTPVCKKP